MADRSHTALLVVDSQTGAFDPNFWGTSRSNPSYEENIVALLSAFRSTPGAQVIHIQHESTNPSSPLHSSSTGMGFHQSSLPLPTEPIIIKSTNSAFIKPDLGQLLKKKQIWKIYFIGLSLDWCLGSTIRHASDLGVADHVDEDSKLVKGDIFVVEDAVAAWEKKGGKFDAETVHGVHIECLRGEFAKVVDTKSLLKELGGME